MHLIGKKNEAENLAKLNQDAHIQYQMEMSKKLEIFELENECFVRGTLIEHKTQSSFVTTAIVAFYKMTGEQLNSYKIKINAREAEDKK